MYVLRDVGRDNEVITSGRRCISDWRNESQRHRGNRFGKKSTTVGAFRSDPHCLAAACHSFVVSKLSLSRPAFVHSPPLCFSIRPIRNSNKAVSGVKNVSGPPWITCRKAEPPGHVYLLCLPLRDAKGDALRGVFFSSSFASGNICPSSD